MGHRRNPLRRRHDLVTATLGNRLIASLVSGGDDIVTGSWRADIMEGGLGNDILKGAGGNDILIGGAGNDRLEGAGGNDIYRYVLGDGHDVVSEFVITWGSWDVIELGAGITAASVGFLANSADVSDMILTFDGGTGSILIDNQILGGEDWGVDQVKFADGTIWNAATLLVEYIARQGSAGDDFIAGTNSAETLNGGDGDDTIRGLAGNDVLNGGDGDDILLPETGVDTVNGGAGWDMVDVSAHTAAMTIDLALTANHANLGAAGTESWNDVEGAIAGSGADTLYGTAGVNRLEGRSGIDTLYGRDGNDVLVGGASDDTLDGGLGDDVFLIGVGDGSDYISGGDGTDTIVASAAGAVILFVRPPPSKSSAAAASPASPWPGRAAPTPSISPPTP